MQLLSSDKPLVSIVISNYNGKEHLNTCLQSVLETSYPNFEIILVDNASTDDSINVAEKKFGSDKHLQIIRNEKDMGFSLANNIGYKYSKGKYIVFLNNDTRVDCNWLDFLVEALENDKSIGMAQSAIFEFTGEQIQTNGLLLSDYYLFGWPVGRHLSIETRFPLTFEVTFAGGAAMIIDRELVETRGLFETIIPMYYDDILLSIKTWLSGKRVVTVSNAKIWHAGGKATDSRRSYYDSIFLQSKICVIFDVYFRFQDLAKAMFFFLYTQVFEMLISLKSKRPSDVLARINALKWGVFNFKEIWENRLRHWRNAKISPQELISKFIRIKIPNSLYLLPPSFWRRHCETQAKQYQTLMMKQSK